jgi:hypothetical protein
LKGSDNFKVEDMLEKNTKNLIKKSVKIYKILWLIFICSFLKKVPPGQYRLYWMLDTETGWVHRMREKPDFEVIASKLTIQNIPEKRK